MLEIKTDKGYKPIKGASNDYVSPMVTFVPARRLSESERLADVRETFRLEKEEWDRHYE